MWCGRGSHPNKKANGSCVIFILLPGLDVDSYLQTLAEIPAPWHCDQKLSQRSPALQGHTAQEIAADFGEEGAVAELGAAGGDQTSDPWLSLSQASSYL